jgi:hypothetical protein
VLEKEIEIHGSILLAVPIVDVVLIGNFVSPNHRVRLPCHGNFVSPRSTKWIPDVTVYDPIEGD